ncbi:DUF438 domain-containing protein [Thermoclostridium caenicola]|uniref:PAC domain-containing protein n=1 Tax=Thermoclostridium caenicola TaxID=659425 RepID=A0A1M6B168_9FIRM|nr:DUF438 domain-containing protein [Thermoclostridium caenicola]SHI42456.1 hypothetical protein SAMN05444373_100232 [Thermoclostridium caenicola]HOL85328.1 DUF438 domain-containing protein [Thermoclostridium caenicola]HOP72539.1 DUF438 domain-containing protein [Thermoclostridium caenicola]HPO77429.1 DUF438 domain-containing protein [Thermoclostridium caenicola]HPU21641.1 DUF438 domain-containing protein [Thermoclostridium caenicola]
MSEMINNREYRQKVLKEIIKELHNGKTVEEVKPRFEELIKGVSSSEIAEMEQALIMEGMPVTEVQRLCDVHASVFRGSIEDIHREPEAVKAAGHPVQIFKQENREIEKLIEGKLEPLLAKLRTADDRDAAGRLLEGFRQLLEVGKHYARKENLLFPYLEKYGITAPPKVMWGVDDEIRAAIKETIRLLENYDGSRETLLQKADEAIGKVREMIFKEENILFPMAMDTLSEDEWKKILEDSDEIGYCLIQPDTPWKPERVDPVQQAKEEGEPAENIVRFDAGAMTHEEINALLNTLPFDITFVGKDDTVRYFTQGKERIFARPRSVIGRKVQNCHPPGSVHIVEKIVEDFKSGKKDHEDFWIRMGDKVTAYIRYYAVRNDKGEYLGVAEITQNIKPIQELEGEKRLLSE